MRRLSGPATVLALAGITTAALAAGGSAQEAIDLSGHPLTGTWMAMANPPLEESPQVTAPSQFNADGTVLLMFPLTQLGQQGVQFNSPYVGTWEPEGDRQGHFTATQLLSDAEGTFLGSVTVDGHPVVSDDGQTFIDDDPLVIVTVRDPAGAIVAQFPGSGGRPITARRMGVGDAGFPDASPSASMAP